MPPTPHMPKRTETRPLLIDGHGAMRLARVPLNEGQFDETWLQRLLFEHPDLIPVDELEPIFGPLIPAARELPTTSGPIDLLYLSPGGYPTVVETKLWRNPEARRQVVAQVIDYATQLSRLSYDGLMEAIRSARGGSDAGKSLVDLMAETEESFDEKRFVDALSRNLRTGRMLLLIVGDGIHESVEQMAETLAGAPQLGFALALVELAIFRMPHADEQFIVQPRIVTRTREVVRAIVEIRGEVKAEDVIVTLPPVDETAAAQLRRPLTQEAFFEELAENCSPATAEGFRTLLGEFEGMGIETVCRERSLALHFDEESLGHRVSFGYVHVEGRVDMFYVVSYCRKAGVDDRIARDYLDDVAALVPRAEVTITETNSGLWSLIKVGKNQISIDQLLPRREEWRSAVQRMIDRLLASGAA